MSCPCDAFIHPPPLDIAAGLARIPRQIAGFPRFRQAMLHAVGAVEHSAALGSWRASGSNDLGLMLLEAWAYLADILAFYDEVHAHECYLRTARLETSVRDLVARLGYRPAPAIAASVELALLADGRRPLVVPVGTAFRSSGFGDQAPQLFEIDTDRAIHPLRSRWRVEAPRPVLVDDPGGPGVVTSTLRLDPQRSARWAAGDLVLVQPDPASKKTWRTAEVLGYDLVTDETGQRWGDLVLDRKIRLGEGRLLAEVKLLRPTRTAGMWIQPSQTEPKVGPRRVNLDGVHRDIRAGELVLLSCATEGNEGVAWFEVTKVAERTARVKVATKPDVVIAKLPLTRLKFDAKINSVDRGGTDYWADDAGRDDLVLHHGLREAGRLAAPPQPTLGAGDDIGLVAAPTPVDDTAATRFILRDVDGVALAGNGTVDFATGTLVPSSFDAVRPALTLPVDVYGNLTTATRGETVAAEVLGSGDAALANQSFRLKKAPLTYLPSATASEGRASTLKIRVDGGTWEERSSFHGAGPDDRIYTVTLAADGTATVTFGDGKRGARLPTGAANVVAWYRHGAGAAAPPAGSIAQIARGVPGLAGVKQPLAATGGSDAESAALARTGGPRRALTLGRAVSILDMEAFAAACNGVRAVAVRWAWGKKAQRPVVQVWVVGDGADAVIRARLLAVTDPTTPIAVKAAEAVPVSLALSVVVAEDRVGSDVCDAVAAALLAPGTGALSVEVIGIDAPFYFSRLAATIHAVPGVVSVQTTWKRPGGKAALYADTPGQGAYFSFAAGVTINGKVYPDG